MYQIFIVEDHPMMQQAYAELVKAEADMEDFVGWYRVLKQPLTPCKI